MELAMSKDMIEHLLTLAERGDRRGPKAKAPKQGMYMVEVEDIPNLSYKRAWERMMEAGQTEKAEAFWRRVARKVWVERPLQTDEALEDYLTLKED